MSKSYTKEETREMFIDQIRVLSEYWANESRKTDPKEKLDGLAFSILSMIDGCGCLPAFDIVVRPHEDDKNYHIEEGEDWFQNGLVINDDVHLHDMWHK